MSKPSKDGEDSDERSDFQRSMAEVERLAERASSLAELREQIESRDAKSAGEVSFMSSVLVQATLPHSDPGDVDAWGRTNGDLSLYIQPGVEEREDGTFQSLGYPYGSYPRLILIWINSQVARHGRRRLDLGESLSEFMEDLGLQVTGGDHGTVGRFREQMRRLFSAKIGMIWGRPGREKRRAAVVADELDLWWDPKEPDQRTLWESSVQLSKPFFEAIRKRPVPADRRILREIKQSSLAVDLYLWTTYRAACIDKPIVLSWQQVHDQMGADYSRIADFSKEARKHLQEISLIWQDLEYETPRGRLKLYPSPPSVGKLVDEGGEG